MRERPTRAEPLGRSEAARGAAVVLAVIAATGLLLWGIEAVGLRVLVPGMVGDFRAALLGCALVLLGLWADLAKPRGLLVEGRGRRTGRCSRRRC